MQKVYISWCVTVTSTEWQVPAERWCVRSAMLFFTTETGGGFAAVIDGNPPTAIGIIIYLLFIYVSNILTKY